VSDNRKRALLSDHGTVSLVAALQDLMQLVWAGKLGSVADIRVQRRPEIGNVFLITRIRWRPGLAKATDDEVRRLRELPLDEEILGPLVAVVVFKSGLSIYPTADEAVRVHGHAPHPAFSPLKEGELEELVDRL